MTDQSRGNLVASAGGRGMARQRGSDDEAGYCDFVTSTAHGGTEWWWHGGRKQDQGTKECIAIKTKHDPHHILVKMTTTPTVIITTCS